MLTVVTKLIESTGQARRELQPLYDGTVCVSRGAVTRSRLIAAAYAAQSLLLDLRNGIWESSGVGPAEATTATEGPITVHVLVVDERLHAQYQLIGLDLLDLNPAVRPAR